VTKILIPVGLALVLMVVLLMARQAQQTPAAPPAAGLPASPRGLAATQVGGQWVASKPGAGPNYTGGKWMTVDYGRPILRGRQDIFGSGAEYGKKVNDGAPVWRAGANQTTRLKTDVPIVLAGRTLPAGEYSVFVDLKPGAWTMVLSRQPYQKVYDPKNTSETWGAFNYEASFDVLRAPMMLTRGEWSVNQFTIEFVNMTDDGGALAMLWERDIASVDFRIAAK
jgi:hypothetical protein